MGILKNIINKWVNNKDNIDIYKKYDIILKRENIDLDISDIEKMIKIYKSNKSISFYKDNKDLYKVLNNNSSDCEIIYKVYSKEEKYDDKLIYYTILKNFINDIDEYTFYIKEENKKQLENVLNSFRIGLYHFSNSFENKYICDCIVLKINTKYNYNPKNCLALDKISNVVTSIKGESRTNARVC